MDEKYGDLIVNIPFGAPYQAINASLALLVLKAIDHKYKGLFLDSKFYSTYP